jgi:hypothetical protein
MKILEFFPVIRYVEIADDPLVQRIEPYEDWALKTIRTERNKKLSDSDWRVLPDSPITNKEEWYRYRQSLRDLPELVIANQFNNVPWPTQPNDEL